MKRTLALALVMGLSAGASATTLAAAGLQHKGTPAVAAAPMTTYGIEVPVRTALKSLVPTGWRMFIHKSAVLPSALSWKPGDQWTDVLSQAATAQGLSVLLDWDSRTAMIRPVDVAMQETVVRTQTMQAASTPLPRFPSSEKVPAAPIETAVAAPVVEPYAPVAAVPAAVVAKVAVEPAAAPVVEPTAPVAVAEVAAPVAAVPAAVVAKVAVETAVAPVVEPSAPVAVAEVAAPVAAAPAAVMAKVAVEPAAAPVVEPTAPVAVAEVAAAIAPEAVAVAAAQVPAEAEQPAQAAVAAEVPTQAARFHVGADGTLTADSAFTALAVAAQNLPLPAAPEVAPGPAGLAALLALQENPENAAHRLPQEGLVVWGKPGATQVAARNEAIAGTPSSELTYIAPAPAASAAPATAPVPVAVAAVVPAPVEVAEQAAPALQLVAPVAKPELPALPVFLVNPTPSMVALRDETEATSPPPVLKSTADFSYTKPVALNKPPVRRVAQGIATRFGVRLEWVAPEIQLEGPVTLLSLSLEQDVSLLNKALGRFSAVTVQVTDGTLSVVSKDPAFVARHRAAAAQEALAAQLRAQHEAAVAQQEAVAQQQPAAKATEAAAAPRAAVESGVASATATGQSLPVAAVPQALEFQLVIELGDTLENGLKRLLQARGYTHEWKVNGGFEANRRLTYEASSLPALLSEVLPPLGISADIYTVDNHIVIRPGDYRE